MDDDQTNTNEDLIILVAAFKATGPGLTLVVLVNALHTGDGERGPFFWRGASHDLRGDLLPEPHALEDTGVDDGALELQLSDSVGLRGECGVATDGFQFVGLHDVANNDTGDQGEHQLLDGGILVDSGHAEDKCGEDGLHGGHDLMDIGRHEIDGNHLGGIAQSEADGEGNEIQNLLLGVDDLQRASAILDNGHDEGEDQHTNSHNGDEPGFGRLAGVGVIGGASDLEGVGASFGCRGLETDDGDEENDQEGTFEDGHDFGAEALRLRLTRLEVGGLNICVSSHFENKI